MNTTVPPILKHACNDGAGPTFGRKTVGCPRCDQLIAGAPPAKWVGSTRREEEARKLRAIGQHSCVAAKCGSVCTAFDW